MPHFLLQQPSSEQSWLVCSYDYSPLGNPNYRNILGGSNVLQNTFHRQGRPVSSLVNTYSLDLHQSELQHQLLLLIRCTNKYQRQTAHLCRTSPCRFSCLASTSFGSLEYINHLHYAVIVINYDVLQIFLIISYFLYFSRKERLLHWRI